MASTGFHGNVGKVGDLQFSNDGKARIKFSVAESHSRFDKQANDWKETGTTWRNVTLFGKRAESLAEVLREGAKQQVVVIGREETREYRKDDGSTGYSFDVVADAVGIIPGNAQPPVSQGWGGQQQTAPADNWGGGQQQATNWGPGPDSPPF